MEIYVHTMIKKMEMDSKRAKEEIRLLIHYRPPHEYHHHQMDICTSEHAIIYTTLLYHVNRDTATRFKLMIFLHDGFSYSYRLLAETQNV